MSTTTLSATSLAVTVAHAVTLLICPLATRLPHSTLSALQTALEANLAAAFASTWAPHDPSRGSGRRVLSFAPGALPPRPVYKACVAVHVDWTMWSAALLGDSLREFDLVVDPGSVCVRFPRQWGPPACIPVWSADEQQQKANGFNHGQRKCGVHTPQSVAAVPVPAAPQPQKTLAQRLIEDDAADEEALFSLLAAEMREPAWKSPVAEAFPATGGALSFGMSTGSLGLAGGAPSAATNFNLATPSFLGHSRSSSRSSVTSASTSSSLLSDDALSSCGSLSSVSTAASSSAFSDAGTTSTSTSTSTSKKDGHGHARTHSTRVFVDTSRTEVTPYDGGKTTVLTGGVMLGAPPARNSHIVSRAKVPRF